MAEQEGYILSEEGVQQLRDLYEKVNRMLMNTPLRGLQLADTDPPAPEVYIAVIPLDGLPGIPSIGTGTGSISALTPSSILCDIYQIVQDTDDSTQFHLENTQNQQDVFNVSSTDLGPEEVVIIVRDKYGKWVATSSSGGTIAESFTFSNFDSSLVVHGVNKVVVKPPLTLENLGSGVVRLGLQNLTINFDCANGTANASWG